MLRPIFLLMSVCMALPMISMAQEGQRARGNPHRHNMLNNGDDLGPTIYYGDDARARKTTRTTTTTTDDAGVIYYDETAEGVRANRPVRPADETAPAPARSRSTTTTEETIVEPAPVSDGVTTGETNVDDENRASPGGLFVEPYISVGQANSSIQGVGPSDNEGTTQNLTGGARLGIHISEIFFGGLDARYSRAKFDDTFLGETTGNMVNGGPMAGLQFPDIGLRAWGSYVLLGMYDPNAGARNGNVEFSDPRGYRVGAGFRIEAVSLNVEYENLTWKDSKVDTVTGPISVPEVDLDNEGFNVSLSFPIEL